MYDSIDPGFLCAPTDTTAIKEFLYHKWYTGQDRQWAWRPEHSLLRRWPPEENLAYVNSTLLAAGMAGFPLGDLCHWFAEHYPSWLSQKDVEDERIARMLTLGPASVNGARLSSLPSSVVLHQNYPNPFNAKTSVRFFISERKQVKVSLCNVAGMRVAALEDQQVDAGEHEMVLDGTNLPSGVYLIFLEAAGLRLSRKALLVK